MTKQKQIKRQITKNGEVRYYVWSMLAMRWLRIGTDEALLLLATEQARLSQPA